jgi:hypothetical protein
MDGQMPLYIRLESQYSHPDGSLSDSGSSKTCED